MKLNKTSDAGRKFCVAGCLIFSLLVFLNAMTAWAQSTPPSAATTVTAQQEKLVREFVTAFNAHDGQRMLALVDERIEWVSIAGATSALEVKGAQALQRSMDAYFKQCPSCQSTLEWVQSSKQRIVTLERAEWLSKNALKSQKGLAVYEFRDGKILRVYYFPAE